MSLDSSIILDFTTSEGEFKVSTECKDFPVDVYISVLEKHLLELHASSEGDDSGLGERETPVSFCLLGYLGLLDDNDDESSITPSILPYIDEAVFIATNMESYINASSLLDKNNLEDKAVFESLMSDYVVPSSFLGVHSQQVLKTLYLSFDSVPPRQKVIAMLVEILFIFDKFAQTDFDDASLIKYTSFLFAKECECPKCDYRFNQALLVSSLINSLGVSSHFGQDEFSPEASEAPLRELYGQSYVDLSGFCNSELLD
ncbi:hypothetical protein [Pseudoalteromonas marina]|uniref:Uncharacterized protein n=2 Tax=Bacteria TaxID=2 RepID=A0ABT9FG80_9GAMM|nr:hypothetical protein [Pseudoalteromonas marina]MDP2565789.1 hypothetical protein [Pseudoalteromonas marina]